MTFTLIRVFDSNLIASLTSKFVTRAFNYIWHVISYLKQIRLRLGQLLPREILKLERKINVNSLTNMSEIGLKINSDTRFGLSVEKIHKMWHFFYKKLALGENGQIWPKTAQIDFNKNMNRDDSYVDCPKMYFRKLIGIIWLILHILFINRAEKPR